jgi:hypothetical protein
LNFDSKKDPLAFVISANLHRRHLNESQRALIGAKLATMRHGANQHTKQGGPIGLSIAETAKLINVGEMSIKRGKEVLEEASPEITADLRARQAQVGCYKGHSERA